MPPSEMTAWTAIGYSRIGSRPDEVPDYLHEQFGEPFNRAGFCFIPMLDVRDGVAHLGAHPSRGAEHTDPGQKRPTRHCRVFVSHGVTRRTSRMYRACLPASSRARYPLRTDRIRTRHGSCPCNSRDISLS
jgi:hypothetical protein